jgi:hypothetical protein
MTPVHTPLFLQDQQFCHPFHIRRSDNAEFMNLGVLHFGHANRKDTNVARRNGTYMAVQPPTGHFLLLTLRITKSYPLKREFSLFKHNKTELPRFNTDSSRLEQQQPCTRISVRHWFGISSELPKSRRVRSYSVFSSDRHVIFLRLLQNSYLYTRICDRVRWIIASAVEAALECSIMYDR